MDLYSIRLALQSSTQKWTEMYLFWKNYLHPRTVASTSKGRIQIWQSRLLSHLHNRNPHAYKDGLHIETGAKIQQTSKRKTFVVIDMAIVMSSYRDYHSHGRIIQIHDDVIKWKHFSRYWPFLRGIHRSPVNSPHQGQWRRALMCSSVPE